MGYQHWQVSPRLRVWATATVLVAFGACAPDDAEPDGTVPTDRGVRAVVPATKLTSDPAVNAFVVQAMDACVHGSYERFREMWSTTEEVMPRDQFERGWKHARKVLVHAVKPLRHPKTGDVLYYVHAGVELDPSVPDPEREVVLLIVNESGTWRLARAPKKLVRRVLGESDADS